MTWKQAATFLIIVFTILTLQSVAAGPLIQYQNSLLDSGDYDSDYLDGEQAIKDLVSSWFDMGLVAVFTLMGVAIARVVRKELTKQQRRP